MAIIPEDIIVSHILRHLPSKSIGRFRCVSKRWQSLLTDPQFIQTHQKTLDTNRFIFEESTDDDGSVPKTLNNKSGIILDGSSFKDGSFCSVPYNKAVPTTIIELPFDLHNLYIYGSINGLVFASGYKTLPYKDFIYLVLNPTTKDYVELPVCAKQFFGVKGFGYDSVSGDYKVVVFSRYENYDGDVYLYNLTTNTMKLVMSRSPYHFNMLPGVFVNGFLHWICYHCSKREEPFIVAFSLADEKLTELLPPSQVDMSDMDIKLVSLGDKLGIFHQVKGDLWVMNDYGVEKSWTKIVVNGFNKIPLYKPIVFYDNGKVLFLTGDRLWIYDVEEGTFSKSVDISYMKIKYFIGAYAESLVSPKFTSTSD
ncbi:F-box associated domain containing protein [Tanacetum coccineum]